MFSFSGDEGRRTGGPITTVGLIVEIDHLGFLVSLNSHKARSAAVLEAPYRIAVGVSFPSLRSESALSRETWPNCFSVRIWPGGEGGLLIVATEDVTITALIWGPAALRAELRRVRFPDTAVFTYASYVTMLSLMGDATWKIPWTPSGRVSNVSVGISKLATFNCFIKRARYCHVGNLKYLNSFFEVLVSPVD